MSARKVMLLGEIGVGKSSIVRRLVFDRFNVDYIPTIGVDVYRYEVPATASMPAQTLIIWDTDGNMGEAIFRHVYIRQASAALCICDATRPGTADTMAKLAMGFMDEMPGRHCQLIVNKTDLVPEAEQEPLPPELARMRLPASYTSALTGRNVVNAFQHAAAAIHRRGH